MKKRKVEINSNNNINIDGVELNDDIFQKELSSWAVRDTEDLIDNLIGWISECRTDDVHLMKSDLIYLINLPDEDVVIFSSIETNEYVAQSDDSEQFNEICNELKLLNETL